VLQSNKSPATVQASGGQFPDVTVIIVSWNVRDLLERCIEAVLDPLVHGDLATEVIVVDNASTDGSVEAARRYSGVQVVECRSNLGYGRANNIGFRAARGGHLLVLNPDALLQPGSLTMLVKFLKGRPGAGIIAPRLLNPDGSSQEAAFRFPTLLMAMLDLFPPPSVLPGRVRHWLLHSKLNGRYPHEARACRPFPIDHPLGACMLINRAAYEQLGGFDEKMFMYSEEIDLAMRYRKASWECWQVPSAQVIHFGGQSTRQLPDRMFVELWRSRLYLSRKHYSMAQQVALSSLLILAQLCQLGMAVVAHRLGQIGREEACRRLRRARATLRLVFQG
jgi:N-acetylglucosaminyl-diphospho-decaprenol L-rhamnosyltransferase